MPPGSAFNGDVRPVNIHIKKGGNIMSSPLREQFTNHLILQRYSPKTRKAYIDAVYGLARYHMKSPDELSNDEIQEYLRYLIEEKELAWSTCNVVFSGLNCFYKNIVKWDENRFFIPRRPRIKQIPMILSIEEMDLLISEKAQTGL
jgi:site-specific recombinase XerD